MSNSFERTKPVPLFETTWDSGDLKEISDHPDVGDLTTELVVPPIGGRFGGGGGSTVELDEDTWGVGWTTVPNQDWNDHLSTRRIVNYETSYLRFRLTVLGGVPGDAVLFAYNAPNVTTGSGIHAYTHLQIPSFGKGKDTADVNRASTVTNHLIKGYAYAGHSDDPESTIKSQTKVSLYGVGKTSEISITARCVLIGGFRSNN